MPDPLVLPAPFVGQRRLFGVFIKKPGNAHMLFFGQLSVDKGKQFRFGYGRIGGCHRFLRSVTIFEPFICSARRLRARDSRDMTVPTGMLSISAASP